MKKEKRLTQPELYERLLAFDIDGPTAPRLPFAERLARENGWASEYAALVVREYKRFLYLAATGTVQVTPSKEVDTAWHLHLTYTRSYWKRLCEELLGKAIHHEPTRGGADECARFVVQYEETLQRYHEEFGEVAPPEVWPPSNERFGPDPRLVWRPQDHWILRKPQWRPARLLRSLLVVAAAPLVLGCTTLWNPFELQGTDFLVFLFPVLVVSLLAGYALRWAIRGPGGPMPRTLKITDYHAAWISGGADGLAATVLASLFERKIVKKKNRKIELAEGQSSTSSDRVEQVVLNQLPMGTSRYRRSALSREVEEAFRVEAARLEAAGVVMKEGQRVLATIVALVPVVVVYATLALPRLVRGLDRGKPVGFLVMMMVLGVFASPYLLAFGERRLTRRGQAWLESRRAVASTEGLSLATHVALFGVTAATLTVAPALATWSAPPPSSSASGGSSSSGCGSSCGGGGCGGGCGGCGS